MVIGTTALALGSAAGAKIIEEITKEIINDSKETLRGIKIKKINRLAFRTIFQKIKSVEMVNTIWKTTDDPVNLREFYHPSKIGIEGLVDPVTAETLADISETENVIIEGTAGQGKSIFLRYITSNEVRKGKRIPLFIELRKLGQNDSIYELIEKKLDSLGFIVSKEITDALLKSGKILLLLDGFDEIHSNNKTKTLTDIEYIAEKFEKTQIAITSRPGSGVQGSSGFRIVTLAQISDSDYLAFLEKVCASKDQAQTIKKAIDKSSISVKRVITTPLLLTLLTILYKTEQAIPDNLIEFYDKLFYVLFSRHDNTKPGFEREIKSKLSENKFEEVFEALCFLSRKAQLTSLSRKDALKLTKQALEITQQKSEETDFIDDCCKVSCLMIKEGFDYHFVHKSVQEFYAAEFISKRTDDFVKKFYNHALDQYNLWAQEIDFLETLDRFRAAKYFKAEALNIIKKKIEEYGIEYILENSFLLIDKGRSISGFGHPTPRELISYMYREFDRRVYQKTITNKLMTRGFRLSKDEYELLYENRDKNQLSQLNIESDRYSFNIKTTTFLKLTKNQDTIEETINETLKVIEKEEHETQKLIDNENKLQEMDF